MAPVTSESTSPEGFVVVPAAQVAPAAAIVVTQDDAMGRRAQWLIPAAIVALSLLTFTQLAALWPAVLSAQPDVVETAGSAAATEQTLTTPEAVGPSLLFGLWHPTLDPELVVLLMVLLAGLLGGLVGAGRKYQHWAQRQQLTKRDEWSYALLPVQGAMLAVIIYFTLRGGFLGTGVPAPINPFGIAAIAALVGLFTDNAMHRLREVMDALLGQPAQPEVESPLPGGPGSGGNGHGATVPAGRTQPRNGKATKGRSKATAKPATRISGPATGPSRSTRRRVSGG